MNKIKNLRYYLIVILAGILIYLWITIPLQEEKTSKKSIADWTEQKVNTAKVEPILKIAQDELEEGKTYSFETDDGVLVMFQIKDGYVLDSSGVRMNHGDMPVSFYNWIYGKDY